MIIKYRHPSLQDTHCKYMPYLTGRGKGHACVPSLTGHMVAASLFGRRFLTPRAFERMARYPSLSLGDILPVHAENPHCRMNQQTQPKHSDGLLCGSRYREGRILGAFYDVRIPHRAAPHLDRGGSVQMRAAPPCGTEGLGEGHYADAATHRCCRSNVLQLEPTCA